MNIPPEVLRERMPVWTVFSEFFLDTELEDDDHNRIASALALSPYTEEELWEILRHEVYPACHSNLLIIAGEWTAFGDDWLIEQIAPRYGKRPRLSWPCLHRWMFLGHWEKVRSLLMGLRAGIPNREALPAGSARFPMSDPDPSTPHPR